MPEGPSTELLAPDAAGMDRLGRTPIIDRVDARTLTLIKAQVAKNCTDAEVGYFLELAAHYDLDPFAREIWCAKDDKPNSRVLIMVGRDGLRKIAQRQGLLIDGDVVREKDEFRVQRTEHGRVIHHAYGMPVERGPIVGAWCQVSTADGREHGYFFAPLSEYRPNNASPYSPWSKQTSVMILAAAERQALRQATPLSGLLAEGEDESAQAIGTGSGTGEAPGWGSMPEGAVQDVERVVERAKALGHAGLSDLATAQMSLVGQPESVVGMWVGRAGRELDEFDERQSAAIAADVEGAVDVTLSEIEARAALDVILDSISALEADGLEVPAEMYAEQERLEGLVGHDEPGEGQEKMEL